MWTWAKLASEGKDNSVYVYQFAKSPPFPSDSEKGEWGATHGSDLYYVFGQFEQRDWLWTETDYQLSKGMINYWTNFAKSENPNGEGLVDWLQFIPDNSKALFIGEK